MHEQQAQEQYIHTCRVCAHTWASQHPEPQRCPRCLSRKWTAARRRDRDRARLRLHEHECQICKHKWRGRSEQPEQCPKCKSRRWHSGAKEAFTHTCLICGHTWQGRVERPKQCPKCWSSRWHGVPRRSILGELKKVPKKAKWYCMHSGERTFHDWEVEFCPKCLARRPPEPWQRGYSIEEQLRLSKGRQAAAGGSHGNTSGNAPSPTDSAHLPPASPPDLEKEKRR